MAPEIHMKQPYSGASVDLFASAIILFIMSTQHPPFKKAVPEDPYYRLICDNKLDVFWKAHARNKPGLDSFFSDDFKDLTSKLFQFNPNERLSIAQIKEHPWFINPNVATLQEI